jgi:class 3 adenylate cyclase/DNA-binding winged helix-turn-helix (wHTH) protein
VSGNVRYRFDDQVLDTKTRELLAEGEAVELEPQVYEVLRFLVENRDRVVAKEELLDNVWGDRFVSESALTTRIKQARQAVGDDGRAQRLIRTAHGHGYRFVARVKEEEDGPEAAADRSAGDAPATHARLPVTHYADSEGASIAFQTFGSGPDLVLICGLGTNVEVQWEHPAINRFLQRLGSFSRVTVLDKRGVGLSDRMPMDRPPPLETRADDLRAVMDAAGIDRATVLGSSEGGSLAVVFTASHPERVDRLVLHGSWARHPEFGRVWPAVDLISQYWGTSGVYATLAPSMAVDRAGRRFLARLERQSATPRAARELVALSQEIDVTPVLGAISVPTLVMHRKDDEPIPFHCAADLAAGIPGARLLALEGNDHFIFSGDTEPLVRAVEEFVCGTAVTPAETERVLATVLFVDIVDSTATARQLGDARWAKLLEQFHQLTRQVVADHRGEVVKTIGDGVVATFDGPGRGVVAACELRDQVQALGLIVRSGLHTAEIERTGDDIAGIGVHIASRVAGEADPGEVWVSRTVTDLVAGTGLAFAERGSHSLKGIDRPWALYEARA